MVSWVDILPTLIEAAGGKPPAAGQTDGAIDGFSFLEVLRGTKDVHRDRIFTTHSGDGKMNVYPIRSLRAREWKYILNLHPEFQFCTHIDRAKDVDGGHYWKSWERKAETDATAAAIVKRYRQRPREELYDLSSDPSEQRNLAGEAAHAARLKSMREEMQAWMKQQGDQGTVFNTPVRLPE
jgi:arylsulfatase A-like enzyme